MNFLIHHTLTTKCDELENYLGCRIVFSKDGKKAWIGQPETIKKLIRLFGDEVMHLRNYTVGGTVGKGVLRPKEDEELLSYEEQSKYRSGVGILLWLTKTRPDICNAVRELTKVNGKATEDAMNEMKRIIKYIIDTKDIGLKFEPKLDETENGILWELLGYSDSDWAGDKDNRKSISGWIIYLLNCPISFKSRQQGTVILSLAEAE